MALPTIVRVTNLYNGYSINVRINDRGPKNNFRIIELSKKTASYLKIKNKGLVKIIVIPDLTIQAQSKLKKNNLMKNNKDNLEKDVALKKELVETENLMNNKKKKNEEIKPDNFINSKEKIKLKINYKNLTYPLIILELILQSLETLKMHKI